MIKSSAREPKSDEEASRHGDEQLAHEVESRCPEHWKVFIHELVDRKLGIAEHEKRRAGHEEYGLQGGEVGRKEGSERPGDKENEHKPVDHHWNLELAQALPENLHGKNPVQDQNGRAPEVLKVESRGRNQGCSVKTERYEEEYDTFDEGPKILAVCECDIAPEGEDEAHDQAHRKIRARAWGK